MGVAEERLLRIGLALVAPFCCVDGFPASYPPLTVYLSMPLKFSLCMLDTTSEFRSHLAI